MQEALNFAALRMAYWLLRRSPSRPIEWLHKRAVLRDVLRNLAIDCVLDVGANKGQYGLLLRGLGYRGWILSFEPVRAHFEALQEATLRDARWRAFPFALGSRNGDASINVAESGLFSSFLTIAPASARLFPKNRLARTEVVAIRRLDDLLDSCLAGIAASRIYLKLDTQGFDLEVLKGATRVLPGIIGLQTEISFKNIYQNMPGFSDSIHHLQEEGFEVVEFLPVSTDLDKITAVEKDCIMVRPSDQRFGLQKPVQAKFAATV